MDHTQLAEKVMSIKDMVRDAESSLKEKIAETNHEVREILKDIETMKKTEGELRDQIHEAIQTNID